MSNKKTLVLGATPNPQRYAYIATQMLNDYQHEVIPLGIKRGEIGDLEIKNEFVYYPDIHTVTLYLGPERQIEYYDYILSLKPSRIIFNPGTENPELVQLAENKGIECIEACTLVMLRVGNF